MEKSVFGFFVSFAGINPRLIPFRILCFFRRKESVHAISRNNPILDFTKEMHPRFHVYVLNIKKVSVAEINAANPPPYFHGSNRTKILKNTAITSTGAGTFNWTLII